MTPYAAPLWCGHNHLSSFKIGWVIPKFILLSYPPRSAVINSKIRRLRIGELLGNGASGGALLVYSQGVCCIGCSAVLEAGECATIATVASEFLG